MARMDPQEIVKEIARILPSYALRRFDPTRVVESCPECTCSLQFYGMVGPYAVFTCPKCQIPYVGRPGQLRSCAKAPPPPPSAETIAAQQEEVQRKQDKGRCDHDWEYRLQKPYMCRRCGLYFGTGDSAEQLAAEQARQRTEEPVIPAAERGVDDVPDPGGRRFCPHCGNGPDQGHLPQCPEHEPDALEEGPIAAEPIAKGDPVGIDADGKAVPMDGDDPDDDACEHPVWIKINQFTKKCRDCGIREPVGQAVGGG